MRTLEAFSRALSALREGRPMRYYDYRKAYDIICQRKPQKAVMAMFEDFEWTAVTVYEDGKFLVPLWQVPDLAGINGSLWAQPTLYLFFRDDVEIITCWTHKKPEPWEV